MVNCTCTVEAIDKACINTPQYCYRCCTTGPAIKTCPYHFHLMGNTAAAARLASGLVHPSITSIGAGSPSSTASVGEPGLHSASERQQAGSAALNEQPPASGLSATTATSRSPQTSPAVTTAPSATASALAALQAQFDTAASATGAIHAALQAQLEEQARALRAQHEEQTKMFTLLMARLPPAAATGPSLSSTAVSPQAPLQSSATSAPHRHAVLDRAAPAVASNNAYDALRDSDSDDDTHEVTTQHHTPAQPASVLPAAFRPVPSGTEQGAQQQLAAILSGLGKQATKVKYATFAELDEALDDWAAEGKKAGWTSSKVDAIRVYQRQLIDGFPQSERWSLKDVLEYHRRWCKAVDAGTIDPFAPGAALNLTLVHEVSHPRQYGSIAASTAPARRGGRSKDSASPPADTRRGGAPAAPKHPAGSCTNHPTSTTHTTAECKRK